jgi:HPt (histidine-containing phosphotransfer) domain-containing protein
MFLRCGADDFLEKPVNIQKLDDVLKRWMPKEKQLAVPEDAAAFADSDAQVSFPPIPGLDVERGLVHSGGSAALYGSVLASFCGDVEEKAAQIEKSAAARDFLLYTTLVHGFKGAAASIGADAAAALAERLERAGERADAAAIDGRTAHFLSELTSLARSIRAALEIFRADAAGGAKQEPLRLEELKKSLLDMDIQTVNAILAECASLPLDAKLHAFVLKTEEHILMFEYDAAIEEIDALLCEIGGARETPRSGETG